ncbi:hypothetical protein [Halosegnis marinus]|uniref:Uncharacterized protein n=1 Tax=Halosegnis marinus TaxID=3034023 RepID=A0ABD5ZU98_9EURY|nr:hypothetical protein [Halosegnis sp. DT85]
MRSQAGTRVGARALAVMFALLLATSMVAPAIALSGTKAPATPPGAPPAPHAPAPALGGADTDTFASVPVNNTTTTTDDVEWDGPASSVTSGLPAAIQSEFNDISADDFAGVQATDAADSLTVELTFDGDSVDPDFAMNFTSDRDIGRVVGIPQQALEQALGRTPAFATVVNSETDERTTQPIRYVEANAQTYALVRFEHFSTNTVYFEGVCLSPPTRRRMAPHGPTI